MCHRQSPEAQESDATEDAIERRTDPVRDAGSPASGLRGRTGLSAAAGGVMDRIRSTIPPPPGIRQDPTTRLGFLPFWNPQLCFCSTSPSPLYGIKSWCPYSS